MEMIRCKAGRGLIILMVVIEQTSQVIRSSALKGLMVVHSTMTCAEMETLMASVPTEGMLLSAVLMVSNRPVSLPVDGFQDL